MNSNCATPWEIRPMQPWTAGKKDGLVESGRRGMVPERFHDRGPLREYYGAPAEVANTRLQ